MGTRRRDSFRGKMVNYSHMLVAALSVTSLVLLVKYRNLTTLMSEEEKEHMQNQKLLLDDLGKETDRTKMLNEELNKRMEDIKKVEERLKGTQDELSNSVNALQASNDQIEVLKSERQSLADDLNNAKEGNSALQLQLAEVQDELQKTKAMIDDNTMTIKDSQSKQEKLLTENTKVSQELTSLKAENDNLRTQVANALKAAQTSEARVKELEAQLQERLEPKVTPKGTKREEPQQDNPGEDKQEPQKDTPKVNEQEPPKDTPVETEKEAQNDTPKEPEKGKEESKKEPIDEIPKGKNPDYKVDEKQIEKDIEVYDMLNEEEKTKLKRELANNEEIPGGGEVVDNPQAPEEVNEDVLADGEGRELDNVAAANDVAAEELNDKIPEEEEEVEEDGELAKESAAEILDENNNEKEDIPAGEQDGNVLPEPKAFEEVQESGGSFDILGQAAVQSWQAESSI